MAILPIRIMGDPVLHSRADEVDTVDDELRTLVADMFDTMDAAPGVGLAAPQVGVPLRVFVYSYVDDAEEPWRGVIINPELWIAPLEPGAPDSDEEAEGCLSFPGERFALRRSERALIVGTDLESESVRIEVSGWRARILQHEFDHLDGVLYVDRLDDHDQRIVQKIARKRSWGEPGVQWMPGEGSLEP